jgi:CheY-like chemotaxis protein
MKKLIIAREISPVLLREESFFNRAEVKVYESATNEDAFELHRAEKADLVIATLDSRDMSGEEFCRAVRGDSALRDVSIILVGPSAPEHMERVSRCRANAFLTLPLSVEAALEKSLKLLDISRRADFRAPVAVKVQGTAANGPFLGYSENISASGLLFDSDRALSVGDRLVCSFMLTDSVRVSSEAEVVRVVDGASEHEVRQCGVRFLRLADGLKSAIEAFIEARRK